MKKQPDQPRHGNRPVGALQEYPLQPAFDGTTTEQDDEQLRRSIEADGLRKPIEILPKNKADLPENTILDGHRRLAALVGLGEEKAPVLIRYDLASADRATLDKLFLEANSVRRQLDPVARAFIAVTLIENEPKYRRHASIYGSHAENEVRERVGALLGISGRHLSRLLRVVRTPLEVQAAVRRKEVSIVLAEKVADLPSDIQEKISDHILQGESAKSAIERYVKKIGGKPASSVTEFSRYLKSLKNLLDRFDGSVDEIKFSSSAKDLEVLKAGKSFHEKLIRQLCKNGQKRNRARRKLQEM